MQTYNFRSSTCILIGDTHSENTLYELLNLRIPNGADVVGIGDHGLGFGSIAYALDNAKSWLDRINKLCVTLDIKLYLIRGNHDNPDIWKLSKQHSNLTLTQSGDIGIFPNDKRVIFVGGGVSVDRVKRIEGETYWVDEPTPYIDNIPICDIMFSHDCPEHFNHSTKSLPNHYGWYCDRDSSLLDDCMKQRLNMSDIARQSTVKTIFSGHFHNSYREERDGVYYRCLDINELFEFDSAKHYSL